MKTYNEIPIFFTIDDAYAPFLAVALNSAIKNCNKSRNYKAIVLYQELNETNKALLSKLCTDNFKIEFTPMLQGFEGITDRTGNRLRCDYFTLTIYFRLFIPEMFPQYDKAVYIDSDVVLNGDLAELFDTDIGENLIGACNDFSVLELPEICNYIENAVGVPKNKYINSGVLLMNLKVLRELKFEEHFLNLLGNYAFDCIAPDQDYINAICNGKIYYLGEEWNTMPNDNKAPLKSPKLIHYNLFSKPWCYDNIQYGEKFWEYASDSEYFEQLKEYKQSYSDEQKKSDNECFIKLISRGNSIPDNEITFKKIFEKGLKIRL